MKRSFYAELSGNNRSELDKRIIDGGWSDYADIRTWLATEGCETSETALKVHAEKLRDKLETLKLQNDYRRAYGEEISADIELNSVNLIASAQRVSQILIDVLETRFKLLGEDTSDPELAIVTNIMNKAISSIGILNNTQVVASKHQAEIRAKQEAKLSELASEGESRGIDAEFMRKIRTEILGIE